VAENFLKLRTSGQGPNANQSLAGDALNSYVTSDDFSASRRRTLQDSSLQIMDRLLVQGSNSSTGLVLGNVQSGKTSSIIGLICAARDNDFPLVVLASGVTDLLQSQTIARLKSGLRTDEVRGSWQIYDTPTLQDRRALVSEFRAWINWSSGSSEEKPKTIIFVPLKTNGLEKTANEIEKAFKTINADLPILVIDDESDSASPNNKSQKNLKSGQNERSTTSKRINRLFSMSSKTKFVMYTATPQANLLMNLREQLNPQFCYVLEPGEEYMGFEEFFLNASKQSYLRTIPRDEIVGERTSKFPHHDTAILAIAIFVVGCAIQLRDGQIDVRQTKHVRSMMMQIAQSKRTHIHFFDIAQTLVHSWQSEFSTNSISEESREIFQKAIADLGQTYESKPLLTDLQQFIHKVLRNLRVELMNSENATLRENSGGASNDRVRWSENAFWILVGGMYMDRGFTVKGLQVSFLPRKPAKNEDSITQRARFFGYHQNYKSYIRIFMPLELQHTYEDIARSATDLRKQMKIHGDNLAAWERDFRSGRNTNPTRKSVIGRTLYETTNYWVNPQDLHQTEEAKQIANLDLIKSIKEALLLDETIKIANLEKYGVFNKEKALILEDISLNAVTELISKFQYPLGSKGPDLLHAQSSEAKKLGFDSVTLVFIDKLDTRRLQGKDLDPAREIGNTLWSGASSSRLDDGNRKYPGDREVYSRSQPTVQFRIVRRGEWYGSENKNLYFAWWAWRNPIETHRLRESNE